MSFQKLFKKANEVSGCNRDPPVTQSDTSVFDTQLGGDDEDGSENADSKASRIKVSDRELDKLRSIIKKVTVNRRQSSIRRVVPVAKTSDSGKQAELHILPEVSWEAEIERAMKVDSSDEDQSDRESDSGISLKKNEANADKGKDKDRINLELILGDISMMRPQQRVTFEVAPFSCFNNDIDDEIDDDPLDVLIPNRERDSTAFADILSSGYANVTDSEQAQTESEDRMPKTDVIRSSNSGSNHASVPADMEVVEVDPMLTMTKAERDKQKKLEKAMRIKGVDIGFDAASSIERSANQRPRDNLPQYRNRASRSLIAALNHCNIATSHKNAKPDLYEVELKYFHRPRMIRERDRPWQIFLKSANKRNASGGSGRHGLPASVGSGKFAAADIDKQNLSIASSAAEFILLEYVEEHPPVLLNYGMASAMFNYYRAPEQDQEEDNTRTKARTESNKLVESVLNDTNRSRLPRHLMLLLQLRNVKQTYDHDVTFPRMKQGEMKVLNSEDDSPFLGKIDEGDIQQSFTNNLFRAPIFKHTAHPTDFLLIRTKLQAGMLTYTMREIPNLYLCGQIEPQKMVPRPVPMITQLQEKFYMLAAMRYLQAHFDGVEFSDLQRNLLKYCLKESASPHKAQHRAKLKPIVRKVGDEVKDNMTGVKWYCKDFSDRADADEAADLERRFSPEELAKTFTPEDVCLQEAANAAEYRLFQQHITDLDLSKVEMWLTHTHRVKQLLMDRAEKAKRLANEFRATNIPLSQSMERFVSIVIKQIQRTDARLAVGRFLFDRLVVAPWNTTEAYVRSHLERDGQGKMELQGVGDPSGRGEGFSFVRIIKQSRGPNGAAAKKNTVKYFDTDKDLRKLTKKDAVRLLVALGVREAEAMALKRWDRVHMIREFSTKLEKTGLAKELHKYARSGVEANATTTESFQATAQDIWNRQKRALTNTSSVLTLTNAASSSKADLSASTNKSAASKPNNSDSEKSDSDSDIDFGEHIARSLAARAAASASIEEKQNVRKEEERKRIEEEKSEFSNIGTFFNSLGNKPGSSANAPSGAGAFESSISKFGEGAAALKKRKVQVSGMGGGGIGPSSSALDSSSDNGELMALPGLSVPIQPSVAALSDWVRPRRVVKRLIRTILSDGTETVRVEFSFAENEVEAVERRCMRLKKDREARRSATAAGGYAAGAGAVEEEEEADDIAPTSMASMKINLSRIKKVVDQNNQMLKNERAAEEQDPYSIVYETGTKPTKSSKRSVGAVINTRVPKISFAVRLEEEVMKIWNNKNSVPFRVAVNAFDAPGYYQRVTDPISLTDIREKIVSYQYETAAALLEDFAKMVRNSELYNGPSHFVTTAANKLLNMLQINLRHDREHLGAEHDSIGIMEEAIRRKKVYLRKNILEPVSISATAIPSASSTAEK